MSTVPRGPSKSLRRKPSKSLAAKDTKAVRASTVLPLQVLALPSAPPHRPCRKMEARVEPSASRAFTFCNADGCEISVSLLISIGKAQKASIVCMFVHIRVAGAKGTFMRQDDRLADAVSNRKQQHHLHSSCDPSFHGRTPLSGTVCSTMSGVRDSTASQ